MRDLHQRTFIALDEWLGIFTAIYLHERGSSLFWPFVVLWALAVYVISYPWYWGWWPRLFNAATKADPAAAAATRRTSPTGSCRSA